MSALALALAGIIREREGGRAGGARIRIKIKIKGFLGLRTKKLKPSWRKLNMGNELAKA